MWTQMVGLALARMKCLPVIGQRSDRSSFRRLGWCLVACMNWDLSNVAQAAPPTLAIASEPLASSCRQQHAGQLDGPALVRAPAEADQAGSLYQARMQPGDWSGSFTRYAMAPGEGGLAQAKLAAWEAGALLTGSASRAPSPPPQQRNLHTAIVQADGTLVMVPFAWNALSPGQRMQLDPDNDGSGVQRLAWLRGERSDEGTLFRARGSVLGDSVHSTPVYVGPSAQPQAPARPELVYLGANDGMLHAFDAADGAELFAYVPAALFGALHRLASKDYLHRAYVDGPARAGEVMIGGSARTVLVSGMGGGAQGVFALDVTDPARFAEQGGVLWEFTDRHDPSIGNVTSMPQLAKLRVGTQGGAPLYRYFAVVASGVNNYADDGFASTSGDGVLFLLALDKPRNMPWRLNDNYYRLRAPIADANLANALHAPVMVNDRQGAVLYAYAGDLQGNLWRFDFAAGLPSSHAAPAADGARLFVARDANGRRQPITQQPQVAYANGSGYLALFGTGKLIEQADRDSTRFAPQSYYAIRDSLHTPPELVTGRRQLTRRELTGDPRADRLDIEGEAMAPDSMGWYVDLLASSATGERSLDSGVLVSGALAFNTMLPSSETAPPGQPATPGNPGAACTPAHSRTYVLNALTGLASGQSVTARLPPAPQAPSPVVAERTTRYVPRPLLLPMASRPTAPREPTGTVKLEQDFVIGIPGAQGEPALGTLHASKRAGRLSWREVANWRQLHQAQQAQQDAQ